jgi:hypothetical protein
MQTYTQLEAAATAVIYVSEQFRMTGKTCVSVIAGPSDTDRADDDGYLRAIVIDDRDFTKTERKFLS